MLYLPSCSSPLGCLLLENILISQKHDACATGEKNCSSMPPSTELLSAKLDIQYLRVYKGFSIGGLASALVSFFELTIKCLPSYFVSTL